MAKKKNEILEEAEAAKAAEPEKKKKKKKKAKKDKVGKAEKKAKKVRVAELVEETPHEEADAKSSKSKRKETLDKVGELMDHPLVADVVAAGAVAAVAALAENKVTSAKGQSSGSRTMLKLAGTAAAAAIGKRLKAEYDAMKAEREAEEGDESDA